MKKTIILNEDNMPLDQIMADALSFSMVFTKRVVVFDSIKEAREEISQRKRLFKGCKPYPLNKNQFELLEHIKKLNNSSYVIRKDFLNLK